jgi:hypothetical protein
MTNESRSPKLSAKVHDAVSMVFEHAQSTLRNPTLNPQQL